MLASLRDFYMRLPDSAGERFGGIRPLMPKLHPRNPNVLPFNAGGERTKVTERRAPMEGAVHVSRSPRDTSGSQPGPS